VVAHLNITLEQVFKWDQIRNHFSLFTHVKNEIHNEGSWSFLQTCIVSVVPKLKQNIWKIFWVLYIHPTTNLSRCEDICKTTYLSLIIGPKAIHDTLKIGGTELSVKRWDFQTVSVYGGLVIENTDKECLLIISFLLSETGGISHKYLASIYSCNRQLEYCWGFTCTCILVKKFINK
jgi:hypothetical protein